MMPTAYRALLLTALMSASALADDQDVSGEFGPAPSLGAPRQEILPTVHIAKAVGWPDSQLPRTAPGLHVSALSSGLQHPRWLYVLPNGDVLVAESEAPPKPDDSKGIGGKIHKLVMKRAGSGAAPSANRITLLRTQGSRVERHTFLGGLNSPIGMALIGEDFYIAGTDALLRVHYRSGDTKITETPTQVTALPAGSINHHWTKSLIASRDGTKLYVGVGSNSNAAENGLAAEADRAAVWEIDRTTGNHRIYASGLRNPVGLAFEPASGVLWVAVNERDALGDHLPPDYMTGLHPGGFYGWPYSYYGAHLDSRVKPQAPERVAAAIAPDFALGAHTASLGLCWSGSPLLPAGYREGMFVGQHGSWNRRHRSGYKVVFVPFTDGKPSGAPVEVLGGFLNDKGQAMGRPVGVAMDRDGALLVADDVGNTVWRVSADLPATAAEGK